MLLAPTSRSAGSAHPPTHHRLTAPPSPMSCLPIAWLSSLASPFRAFFMTVQAMTVQATCVSNNSVSCDLIGLLNHPEAEAGFLGPCLEVAGHRVYRSTAV